MAEPNSDLAACVGRREQPRPPSRFSTEAADRSGAQRGQVEDVAGLDLDWAFRERKDSFPEYIGAVLGVLARVLTLPCVTVCACNGHAFGAGAQLLAAHDYRLMRADRGYFCMPEIDMRAHLHPGMTALLAARLPGQTVHEVLATGRRYGGADARAAGIVEEALSEAELLPHALAIAAPLAAKAHPVMKRIKADLYPHVLAALALRQGPA